MELKYAQQTSLFEDNAWTAQFPTTRYQGSKSKLVEWIWEQIANLEFSTCLDAFGGTGAVAYRLKQAGKEITYNDLLRFNYYFGVALIENSQVCLSPEDIEGILSPHPDITYPRFVQDTFSDIYFTDEENAWIDQTYTNIQKIPHRYKRALAFFALAQAAIVKRPYNLFHRKNLYVRLADVERSFGNKTSWDRPFEEWFLDIVTEANRAIFDNGRNNRALNQDVFSIDEAHDLVYIDPPYISNRGTAVDYRDFYHFLEGLTMYDSWGEHIDYKSKHRRLKRKRNPWADKDRIHQAFERLFEHFQNSVLVVSYRSDGIPGEEQLYELLSKHKAHVEVKRYGHYKYVLSTNRRSEELLFIAY